MYWQSIPTELLNLDQLHKEDMRRRIGRYWPQYYANWIATWNDHQDRIIQGNEFNRNDHLRDKTICCIYIMLDNDGSSFPKFFNIVLSFILN